MTPARLPLVRGEYEERRQRLMAQVIKVARVVEQPKRSYRRWVLGAGFLGLLLHLLHILP